MNIKLNCDVHMNCGCCSENETQIIDFETFDELYLEIDKLGGGYYDSINIDIDDEDIPDMSLDAFTIYKKIQPYLTAKNTELYLKRRMTNLTESIKENRQWLDNLPEQMAKISKQIEIQMTDFNSKGKELEECSRTIEAIKRGENLNYLTLKS